MAHFAEIDGNNIVVRVLVVPGEQEHRGQDYLSNDCQLGGVWLQTSYNTIGNRHLAGGTPFRGNYAGIGYTYDEARDVFIAPQPFPSWLLDDATMSWIPPVAYPDDGNMYWWDEDSQTWRTVE